MTQSTANITLGTGQIWFDDTEVGYLKGDVEFVYNRDKLDFKPSGATAPVAQFILTETCELRASIAEFKAAHIRMAMGVTQSISTTTTSNPDYNPASFSSISGQSYNFLRFGGEEVVDFSSKLAIRFEHERRGQSSTKKIVIILYAAVCLGDFSMAFHEEDFDLTDIVFTGTPVVSRSAGDQVGMIIEQVI